MNILSIDWDYFFPDSFIFDWQFQDNNKIYCEILWPIRWSNRNIFDHKIIAKDVYHPDLQLLNGFLDKILINSFPSVLVISDTHIDIKVLIDNFPKSNIYNFDQHHDVYYQDHPGKTNDILRCDNWVSYLTIQIKSYHLFYPPWRKTTPEDPDNNYINSISYSIPEDPPVFDAVFLCRSSPWTPPWSDHKWIEFIKYFKINYPLLWKHKLALDYVLEPRPFDQQEAERYEQQTKEIMKELNQPQQTN